MNRFYKHKKFIDFSKYFINSNFLDINFNYKTYDIIIFTDYVLCYQKNYRNIKSFLKKVYTLCKKNTLVLFDIPIVEYKLEKDLKKRIVEYTNRNEQSLIKIKRKYIKKSKNLYTFFYNSNYQTLNIDIKMNWTMDFFYTENKIIYKIVKDIFYNCNIKIIYSNRSIFYYIKC